MSCRCAPARRRLGGAGRLLLATATADARRRGLRPVLDVLVRNHDASQVYEALGWRILGEFTWEMPDGSAEPAYAYTLS